MKLYYSLGSKLVNQVGKWITEKPMDKGKVIPGLKTISALQDLTTLLILHSSVCTQQDVVPNN